MPNGVVGTNALLQLIRLGARLIHTEGIFPPIPNGVEGTNALLPLMRLGARFMPNEGPGNEGILPPLPNNVAGTNGPSPLMWLGARLILTEGVHPTVPTVGANVPLPPTRLGVGSMQNGVAPVRESTGLVLEALPSLPMVEQIIPDGLLEVTSRGTVSDL